MISRKSCLFLLLIIQTVNLAVQEVAPPTSAAIQNEDFPKLFALENTTATWSVEFVTTKVNVTMTQIKTIDLIISDIDPTWGSDYEFHILPYDEEIVHLTHNIIYAKDVKAGQLTWQGNFSVEGLFLGHTPIYVELRRPDETPQIAANRLDIIVLRNIGTMDLVFNILVGSFVMLLYINFGAVLELDALKRILLKPIGPAIGFVGQFLVMPILSFLIGYVLFRDMIELRLGLFFTGSTPGGGASNIFTVILNGDLNLSITMTAISNLAAFVMMPIWIFTLGALIFQDGDLVVPYKTIATMSFSLVIPLCIGIALQKCAPAFAKKLSKLLKPLALGFIIIITGFAFTVNSYMFKLFSWKIIVASSALPWIGYLIGWLMAVMCRQPPREALTIAIETGIQNTGIAIFMLNFSLPQPQADMTSAVPVANSMMTPLPLLMIYLIKLIFCRNKNRAVEELATKDAKLAEVESFLAKEGEKDVNKN